SRDWSSDVCSSDLASILLTLSGSNLITTSSVGCVDWRVFVTCTTRTIYQFDSWIPTPTTSPLQSMTLTPNYVVALTKNWKDNPWARSTVSDSMTNWRSFTTQVWRDTCFWWQM